MAETLLINPGSKQQKYETLLPQVASLIQGEPDLIACSSASRSEIVVPLMRASQVFAVLDIDSDRLQAFDATDARYLEQIAGLLA